MQIKDIEKLETQLNEIGIRLDEARSLSKILLEYIQINGSSKPCDVENLTSVLNKQIASIKEKFNLLEKELNF